MTTISAAIPDKLYENLCSIAKELKRSKSFLIGEALEKYLQDIMEDLEDIKEAEKILAKNNPVYSLESVMNELDLDKAE